MKPELLTAILTIVTAAVGAIRHIIAAFEKRVQALVQSEIAN